VTRASYQSRRCLWRRLCRSFAARIDQQSSRCDLGRRPTRAANGAAKTRCRERWPRSVVAGAVSTAIGSGLLAPRGAAHPLAMSTKSRDVLYGSSVRAAQERASKAAEKPTSSPARRGQSVCWPMAAPRSRRRRWAARSTPGSQRVDHSRRTITCPSGDQSRHIGCAPRTSAFARNSDIARGNWHASEVPQASIATIRQPMRSVQHYDAYSALY
jgi:hypothetical protein